MRQNVYDWRSDDYLFGFILQCKDGNLPRPEIVILVREWIEEQGGYASATEIGKFLGYVRE